MKRKDLEDLRSFNHPKNHSLILSLAEILREVRIGEKVLKKKIKHALAVMDPSCEVGLLFLQKG